MADNPFHIMPKARNHTERIIKDIMRRGMSKPGAMNDLFDLIRQLQIDGAVLVDGEPVFDKENFRDAAIFNSELRRLAAEKIRKNGDPEMVELYKRSLLLDAKYNFDCYCRYLEWNRPAKKKFYEPRRKQLKPIADAMQQNMYLQREITAARELYNDTINEWNRDIFAWPTKMIVAAKNGDARIYPASMTKIMTVIIACENISDINDTFTITNGTNGTDGKDGKDGKDGVDGKDGTNGTNGVDGKDGANGTDGQTPYIGENGNWWIGDTDTGVKAAGDDGKDGAIIVATAVGGTALISNIALIAWTLIKKKRLF